MKVKTAELECVDPNCEEPTWRLIGGLPAGNHNLYLSPPAETEEVQALKARVAELEEGIARCRQQASYCIGNEEALKNQLSKVRDIANEVLISKGASHDSQ